MCGELKQYICLLCLFNHNSLFIGHTETFFLLLYEEYASEDAERFIFIEIQSSGHFEIMKMNYLHSFFNALKDSIE